MAGSMGAEMVHEGGGDLGSFLICSVGYDCEDEVMG